MLYILVEAIYSYREQEAAGNLEASIEHRILSCAWLEFFRALIFLFDSVTSHDQMSMNARGWLSLIYDAWPAIVFGFFNLGSFLAI